MSRARGPRGRRVDTNFDRYTPPTPVAPFVGPPEPLHILLRQQREYMGEDADSPADEMIERCREAAADGRR